jgi:hypothetical protein
MFCGPAGRGPLYQRGCRVGVEWILENTLPRSRTSGLRGQPLERQLNCVPNYARSADVTRSVSPRNVSAAASAPAGSSMTAKARRDPVIRQGGTAGRTFSTRPSLATNATSIAKRMKKVWMALEGAMMSALPGGNPSCFRSPFLREAESKAVINEPATTRSLRTLTSTHAEELARSSGSRNDFMRI